MKQRSFTGQGVGPMGQLANHSTTKEWILEGWEPAGPLSGTKQRNMFSQRERTATCMEKRKSESTHREREIER